MADKFLWEYDDELDIISPDGQIVISVHNSDERFVRALTHLLNETPICMLTMPTEEMDARGLPYKNGR